MTARSRFLVTIGAGFIGSAVVRHLIRNTLDQVPVVNKLSYPGNLSSLAPVSHDARYRFIQADIADGPCMHDLHASGPLRAITS